MRRVGLLLCLVLLAWSVDPTLAQYAVVESSVTSVESTDVTTHDVSYPSGVQAGDLLVCGFYADGNPGDPTWPGGWTDCVVPGASPRPLTVKYRTAAGTESGTFTITLGSIQQSAHFCLRLSQWAAIECGGYVAHAAGVDPNPGLLTWTWGTAGYTTVFAVGGWDTGTNSTLTACPADYATPVLAQGGTDDTGASLAHCRRQVIAASDNPAALDVTGAAGGQSESGVFAIKSATSIAGPSALKALLRMIR